MIVVLTWCGDPEALYGTLLTFKTLRVGFPDDDVLVVDNGSHPQVIQEIALAAQRVGANFVTQSPVPHWLFLRRCLADAKRPIVFADPDLIFWERMTMPEEFSGRLIPDFNDPYTGCLTKARLHTSLWMVPDPQRLTAQINELERDKFDANALRPVMVPGWVRYDTGAVLYQALGGRAFTHELDCYDHLFCGSHLSLVAPSLPDEHRAEFEQVHALAKAGDLLPLRGLWKRQERFFKD